MELDWGGIAKGYGIDLASKSLLEMGISRGFINAGGDLYCWGKNPDNRDWNIGIQHPRKEGYLGILSISDLGAATTGDYQRYFMVNGVRYHHVFDPRTGYPAKGKRSVTVIGPETVLCDALSTALFVCKQPAKILEKYPDYGVIIVDSDGKLFILGKTYPFRSLQ
jgi:thiamine biosynthesis lipoprotein